MPALAESNDEIYLIKATVTTRLQIPFYASLVTAGFTSPAEPYIERVLDLNDLCITHPEATYYVRVTGDSMTGDNIHPGDVVVVDASVVDWDGLIAVVWYNGGFTVKRVQRADPLIVLLPANSAYEPIYVQPGDEFKVFGVVTYTVHKHSKRIKYKPH